MEFQIIRFVISTLTPILLIEISFDLLPPPDKIASQQVTKIDRSALFPTNDLPKWCSTLFLFEESGDWVMARASLLSGLRKLFSFLKKIKYQFWRIYRKYQSYFQTEEKSWWFLYRYIDHDFFELICIFSPKLSPLLTLEMYLTLHSRLSLLIPWLLCDALGSNVQSIRYVALSGLAVGGGVVILSFLYNLCILYHSIILYRYL